MAVFVTNVVVTAPTVPGGYGTVVFDVTSSTGGFSASLTQNGVAINATSGTTPATGVTMLSTSGTLLLSVGDVAQGGEVVKQLVRVPAYLPPPVLGCTDPAADNYDPSATQDNGTCTYTPVPRVPYWRFSPAQSLGFADQPFGTQTPLNLTNPGYCQKVERTDTLVVQWQSNYTGTHQVQVVPCDGGSSVLTVSPTKVLSGTGMSRAFDAYARLDELTGNTRLYFNDDALPLPLLPGTRITLTNAGSLSGTYPIADVREDPAAGVPYLLITKGYPGGAQRIDVSLSTPYVLQPFDTWQAVVSFTTVPSGCFAVKIMANDAEFGTREQLSEPLDVATVHPDSVLVVYRNFDNAFGLNYTAGMINRLRVTGQFFKQENPEQKTTLRESTGNLLLLSAEIQRRKLLKTFLLPDYVHEKLAIAFCHDFVRVNGLKGIAEESYKNEPSEGFTLTNGSVLVEEADFMAGNRDDIGDVDGGNFLLVNQEFLAINP
jgi:hypothetical protein